MMWVLDFSQTLILYVHKKNNGSIACTPINTRSNYASKEFVLQYCQEGYSDILKSPFDRY